MSISSVAASIAALRQQPTPSAARNGASRPAEPEGRHAHSRAPALVTASLTQTDEAAKQGELLNTLV